MIYVICPQCSHENELDAKRCASCGESLADAPDSAGHDTRPGASTHSAGAIWLDAPVSRFDTGMADTVPMPVYLSLRDVVVPAHKPRAPRPKPPSASDLPVLSQEPEAAPTPEPASAPAAAPVDPETWLAADRAAKRAFVRRSRRRNVSAARAAATSTDVLLFDRDPASRDRLFSLLTAFGFGVLSADSLDDATALAAERSFIAAFVDLPLGGAQNDPGVGLCQSIKSAPRAAGEGQTLLVWVGTKLRPVERVRAQLAGFDEMLVKPLSRSDVARVLDSHGIALPADPRQG